MINLSIKATGKTISDAALADALQESLKGRKLAKVLLVPPDLSRLHSYAGKITALYYQILSGSCQVDIMPALGTHDALHPLIRPQIEREAVRVTKATFAVQLPFSFVSQQPVPVRRQLPQPRAQRGRR